MCAKWKHYWATVRCLLKKYEKNLDRGIAVKYFMVKCQNGNSAVQTSVT